MPVPFQTVQPTYVDWRSDGTMLAIATASLVNIIDADTEVILNTLADLNPQYTAAKWSPDGDQLAIINGSSIQIWEQPWNISATVLSYTFQYEGAYFNSVSWNPDHKRIASARGSYVDVWDVDTGAILYTVMHDGDVRDVSWRHDGSQLATASTNGEVRIWDGERGTLLNNVVIYTLGSTYFDTTPVSSLSWSPDDNQIAVAAEDGTIRIWTTMNADPISEPSSTLTGHRNAVESVTWSPDGSRIASASWDGTVRIWNGQTGELLQTIPTDAAIFSVTWSPDGHKLAYGANDGTAVILSIPQEFPHDAAESRW